MYVYVYNAIVILMEQLFPGDFSYSLSINKEATLMLLNWVWTCSGMKDNCDFISEHVHNQFNNIIVPNVHRCPNTPVIIDQFKIKLSHTICWLIDLTVFLPVVIEGWLYQTNEE